MEDDLETHYTLGQTVLESNTPKSRLAIHSYTVPFEGPLFDSGVSFSAFIGHFYTGERGSLIKLWLRPARSGVWNIFPIQLDLASLQSSAFRMRTQGAPEWEAQQKKFVVAEQEKQIVLEEKNLIHYAAPVASGRRFIWWTPVVQPPVPEEPTEDTPSNGDDNQPKEKFRVFLSVTDELAKMDQWDGDIGSRLDPTQDYGESSAGKQLKATRCLDIPYELASSTYPTNILMEEYSGSIIVQLPDGNLWLLRY